MRAKNIMKRKYLVLCVAFIMLFVKKIASRRLNSELDDLAAEEKASVALEGSI